MEFRELFEASDFGKQVLKSARANIKRRKLDVKVKAKAINKANDIYDITFTNLEKADIEDMKKWLDGDKISVDNSTIGSDKVTMEVSPK